MGGEAGRLAKKLASKMEYHTGMGGVAERLGDRGARKNFVDIGSLDLNF